MQEEQIKVLSGSDIEVSVLGSTEDPLLKGIYYDESRKKRSKI